MLRTQVVIDKMVPKRDEKGNPELEKGSPVMVKYTRVRADGGTFTAAQAKEFGLIDGIEDLPAAVRSAATRAGLASFKAVVYEKPPSLVEKLTGLNIKSRTAFDRPTRPLREPHPAPVVSRPHRRRRSARP